MLIKYSDISRNEAITDSKKFKKEVDYSLGIPRTRLSDCSRLIFSGDNIGYFGINDKITKTIFPDNNLPELRHSYYDILISHPFNSTYVSRIYINGTINDLVKQISKIYQKLYNTSGIDLSGNIGLENLYLYRIVLKKNGKGWLDIDTII